MTFPQRFGMIKVQAGTEDSDKRRRAFPRTAGSDAAQPEDVRGHSDLAQPFQVGVTWS